MRVFKTKSFARFARKEGISNTKLSHAVLEIEKGLYEADLGGGLIKKRVARLGEGKKGGYRTAVAYREGMRSVFLHGFPKNDKGNFTVLELEELKKFAKLYLFLADADINKALKEGKIVEVKYVKPTEGAEEEKI
ncbi:MAG: type II toxin-antitoxin system RelE/ParE family toxin [Dissulfurispiraceae bacterium]